MSYRCPGCNSWDTYWSAREANWVCNDCGKVFSRGEAVQHDLSRRDPDSTTDVRGTVTRASGTRRSSRRRQVGDTIGGYTVRDVNDEGRVLWERSGHFIVDQGSRRILATRDEAEAKKVFEGEKRGNK